MQCPPCATGTCGGGGTPGLCGEYRLTEDRIRAAYKDTGSWRLCGLFDDGRGGTLNFSESNRKKFDGRECPKETQTCVNNLCVEKKP